MSKGMNWKKPKIQIPLEQYQESIMLMMRYGGSVDRMAKDLNVTESRLIAFIKKEGMDKKLGRRSWSWKSAKKNRRRLQARDGFSKNNLK